MRKAGLQRTLICAVFALLVWTPCGRGCGPGRGGGRRRSPRKLTPLVFKQHVPNVAENTLGASGLTEGRISRDDPRFNDLVPNYNNDILFSDEEGTGADRLMTERCKEKLNTLAISVMNQWPGVRVRVVEAWDEGSRHAPHSLHYEGRAVDVATSDKDYSKHGMLARLAVQAGFDWVYYESRSRIHCSVKSESSSRRKLGGCFPGWAQVDTLRGKVPLDQLREGDQVRVLRPNGDLAFSPVLMFLHRDTTTHRVFLTLRTSSGATLSLTPSHLVFVLRGHRAPMDPTTHDVLTLGEVVLAGRIHAGDYLLVEHEGRWLAVERVVDIGTTRAEGVFAPLTAEGTLVVDGVVASCYAVIDSQTVAHWAFLPVRLFYKLRDAVDLLLGSVGFASDTPVRVPRTDPQNNNTYNSSENSIYNHKYQYKSYYHNSSKVDRWRLNTQESLPKSEAIHWYPKLLYKIASYIMPSHMVYS